MTTYRDDGVQPLVYLADGDTMILPDQADLLHASFARRGDNLLLGDADRPALVILDYFASDQSPSLQTEGGAILSGKVIAKLAGADPAVKPDAATPSARTRQ